MVFWGLGLGFFGFGAWGLGFGAWGLGFGDCGLGFGVWGLGFRAFKVYGLGFRDQGSRVSSGRRHQSLCFPEKGLEALFGTPAARK